MTFSCLNEQYYFERIPLSQNINIRFLTTRFSEGGLGCRQFKANLWHSTFSRGQASFRMSSPNALFPTSHCNLLHMLVEGLTPLVDYYARHIHMMIQGSPCKSQTLDLVLFNNHKVFLKMLSYAKMLEFAKSST